MILRLKILTEWNRDDITICCPEYQLYIVGEQGMKVEHVLLGIPGTSLEEIKTVYSHPQALAQCKKYLEKSFGLEKLSRPKMQPRCSKKIT